MRGHYDDTPPRSLLGSTLGVVAVALGIGFIGAIALDYHSHECDKCRTRWSHLGAFNGGDMRAHTCPTCGAVQWWKRGASPSQREQSFVDQATTGDTHVPHVAIAEGPQPQLALAPAKEVA